MIGGTLARYLSIRFAKTILATFAGVFVLIFTVDLVETLRRSGDTAGATGPLMAWLSFLHTPTVAEQALPFAVLFGAMIAFLKPVPQAGTGRRARRRRFGLAVSDAAAGWSCWSSASSPSPLYNPLSAAMKQQADAIEAKLFGAGGQSAAAPRGSGFGKKASTARRSSMPSGVADHGATLSKVTVFDFDKDGALRRTHRRRRRRRCTTASGAWNRPTS